MANQTTPATPAPVAETLPATTAASRKNTARRPAARVTPSAPASEAAAPESGVTPAAPVEAVAPVPVAAEPVEATTAAVPVSNEKDSKAAKPEKTGKVAKAAKPAKPAKARPEKAEKAEKVEKPRKPRLVRDSYTLPAAEHAALAGLKKRALELGVSSKKSELLRAGLQVLAALDAAAFKAALAQVEVIKTGRPRKGD